MLGSKCKIQCTTKVSLILI